MRQLVALAAFVTLLAFATTASALPPSYTVQLKLTVHLPKDATVVFHDHGGRCDADKLYPRGLAEHMSGVVTLFKVKREGSCLTERSDAQYKVVVTLKDGKDYWSYVNVVQEYLGAPKFFTHCYGGGTLPCEGAHNNPTIDGSLSVTGMEIPLRLGPIPGAS